MQDQNRILRGLCTVEQNKSDVVDDKMGLSVLSVPKKHVKIFLLRAKFTVWKQTNGLLSRLSGYIHIWLLRIFFELSWCLLAARRNFDTATQSAVFVVLTDFTAIYGWNLVAVCGLWKNSLARYLFVCLSLLLSVSTDLFRTAAEENVVLSSTMRAAEAQCRRRSARSVRMSARAISVRPLEQWRVGTACFSRTPPASAENCCVQIKLIPFDRSLAMRCLAGIQLLPSAKPRCKTRCRSSGCSMT